MLVQSLETLAAYDAIKIYMSHGTVIDNATFRKGIEDIKG
jgi:hypothetical protein